MALSINRNFKDALYNKAVTLGKMGEPEKAIQLYDKVLELDPSNADALNNKFIELSKVSPNFSPINGNDEIFKGHYVYVSSTAGEPISISIQKLKIQVEKQHDNYKLIFKLGEKLENMSKFTEAINYYNKSLAVNPKYVPALNHIGYLMNKMCEKMCNPPPGKSYLDKASQLSNSTSQIDINLTEKDVNLGTSYAIVATSNEQSPF